MPGAWNLHASSQLNWSPFPPPLASPPPPSPLPPPPKQSRLASNLSYFVIDTHPALAALAIGFNAYVLCACVRHGRTMLLRAARGGGRTRRGKHERLATVETPIDEEDAPGDLLMDLDQDAGAASTLAAEPLVRGTSGHLARRTREVERAPEPDDEFAAPERVHVAAARSGAREPSRAVHELLQAQVDPEEGEVV